MSEEQVQRRLAAIVAADMVGYSRLMEADEIGTIRRQQAIRAACIDPEIASHAGRLVKTTGDGMLIEFPSVVDAVSCAVAIQTAISASETEVAEDRRIRYRMGINLGDIVVSDDDIFGDGVNVAARLEQLAEPGAILVSASVRDQVDGKLDLSFDDLGELSIKNISKRVRAFRIAGGAQPAAPAPHQEIRYCRSADGTRLAYAAVGSGPPIIKAPNWLNHLEYDWESPVWRHLLDAFSDRHTLVRFDARGTGLSDRDVDEISLDKFVEDLEAVVEASGYEKFALLGISQGCATSIAYAAKHPERVTHLVLHGGFAVGWRRMRVSDEERQRREAMIDLARSGWGQDNPAFRQFFTSLFIPDASSEQARWFNDLQRITASPENAARVLEALGEIGVHGLLRQIETPTLVTHSREDAMIPFESGRFMAREIPGARLVPLESRNHLILDREPAWPVFVDEVNEFLGSGTEEVTSSQPASDRPSIAVLPFDNLSGDPEQDYFADGIVEDITTALSHARWLFVMSRNSSFTYKGRLVDVKQVGLELGVRYVLEGSVRRAGSRVRITGQLVETEAGGHVWADRYDGELDDIFDLQDRITESVVGAIEPDLRRAETSRALAKPTESLDAYDLYLRGVQQIYLSTHDSLDAAVDFLRKAIEIDPDYLLAKAYLALAFAIRHTPGWDEPSDREDAIRIAHDVIQATDEDPTVLRTAGYALAYFADKRPGESDGDLEAAAAALQRAKRLHPTSAQTLSSLGFTYIWSGEPELSVDCFRQAIRISPRDQEKGYMLHGLATAFVMLDRLEEALETAHEAIAEMPRNGSPHRVVIVALVRLGRMDEARAATDRLLKIVPDTTLASVSPPSRPPDHAERFLADLRRAGYPE